MKLSLCITTFNRTDMVIEAFEKVYDHELIDEIIVVDDASEWSEYCKLSRLLDHKNKVKLFRNENNLGMSLNKKEAINKAKNEWCILFDSDNILYPEYLDALKIVYDRQGFQSCFIYCPEYAEPDYDFSMFKKPIHKHNAKKYLDEKMFRVFLNTCNYVVNRDRYLDVYKTDESIKESDTIYFNYLWLKEGGTNFYIVPGMKYYHRRHEGSGWLNGDHRYNMKKAAELQNKIKNL